MVLQAVQVIVVVRKEEEGIVSHHLVPGKLETRLRASGDMIGDTCMASRVGHNAFALRVNELRLRVNQPTNHV